jgi:hypothetical protein
MTGHEASDYLRERHGIRRTAATLAKLRCVGGGPSFYKVGRDVIYNVSDLDAWAGKVKSGPLASTSEGRYRGWAVTFAIEGVANAWTFCASSR